MAGILAVVRVLLVPGGLLLNVDGLPVIASVPGVTSISAFPFDLAVAGGSAVISFPAVDGVLAVASISADPFVPILTGGFTYWTVQ